MTRRLLLIVVVCWLVAGAAAHAATGINRQIHFQGKIVNTNGTNVTNGSYSFDFKIYTVASAGSPVWTETKTLTVTDSIFRTALGDTTSLPGSIDFNTDNIYLGITFNSDGEMSPRVRFAAVPQAFNAEKVGGLSASVLATLAGTETFTNKTIGSTGLIFSGATTDIDTAASEGLAFQGRAASSFTTTAGGITLQAAGSGTASTVQVGAGGAGSTTPDFFGLDVKSDTGDPVVGGFEGAMYYNTFDNKFRCYQNLGWTDCIGTGGGGSPTLDAILAATADGAVRDSNAFTANWNWDFTSAGVDSGLNISESSASILGTQDQQALLKITTLSGSTASPLQVTSNSADVGDIFFNLASAGDLEIRDAGTPFVTFADTGTTTINSGGLALNGGSFTSTGNITFDPTSTVIVTTADTFQTDDVTAPASSALTLTTSTSGAIVLQPLGSGATGDVQIGAGGVGSTTPDLLKLDVKSNAGDPTGANGASYYNANTNRFRCFENSAWKDCDTAGSGGLPSLRTSWFLYEDWKNPTITAGTGSDLGNIGDLLWTFVSIGTGGTLAKNDVSAATSDQGRIGVLRLNSPATVSTGAALTLDSTSIAGVPGTMTVEFDFASVTDNIQQTLRLGLHDSTTTAAPTDGIYFQYNVTTTAGNWFRCTRNNSAETCTDTGIAKAAINTYQKFKIATNAAGTQVDFSIDDVAAGSITTNLPAAARSYGPALNANTVTATIRQWKTDYWQLTRTGVTR